MPQSFTSILVIITFLFSLFFPAPKIFADGDLSLPAAGTLVSLSPAFKPVTIKGIKVDAADPLHLDFIIDTGDAKLSGQALREETGILIQYFLAALTIPDDDLWVNLSPYEKDRVIPGGLARTEMGKDLLSQDYALKQLTASLMYPEAQTGKEFWSRVYEMARERYGTTEIPVNTFNKVWIVPDRAVVYQHQDPSGRSVMALLGDNHLKVMLEQDYLALERNLRNKAPASGMDTNKQLNSLSSGVVKEVLVPQIEKDVNAGANFAKVRQISDALILAEWFKRSLKESLLGQKYSNKNKVSGIESQERNFKEKIYHQYLAAFKKGIYNYVKEETDPWTQKPVARKYFSGGYDGRIEDLRVVDDQRQFTAQYDKAQASDDFLASVNLAAITGPKEVLDLAVHKRLLEIQRAQYQGFPVVGKKDIPTGIQYALAYYDQTYNGNNPLRAMIREGRLRAGPDNQETIEGIWIENKFNLRKPSILVSTDSENQVDEVLIKMISGDQVALQFREWKKGYRSNLKTLSLHTAGVIAKPVEVLGRYGIFDLFKDGKGGFRTVTMREIIAHAEFLKIDGEKIKFNTPNRHYLHGVLRGLNSLGWLTRKGRAASDDMEFTLTPKGQTAIGFVGLYARVAQVIPEFSRISDYLFNRPNAPQIMSGKFRPLALLSQLARKGWNIPSSVDEPTAGEIRGNLNGYLVGNLALSLYLENIFNLFDSNLVINLKDIVNAKGIKGSTDELKAAFDIFVTAGFLQDMGQGRYKKTNEGLVAFDRVLAYGVPFSYRPSFDLAEQFLFGNAKDIKRYDDNGRELLVYRYLNVLGSGASHDTYFKQVDQILKNMMAERVKSGEILPPDKLSAEKPFVLAISDTGCGDGTFLAHIHYVVLHETSYGQLMKQFPLLYKLEMVGVDYNMEAQSATSQKLHSQGIEHIVMFGNINDPWKIVHDVDHNIDEKFRSHGINDIHKLVIHTRTFLDHNRPWKEVQDKKAAGERKSSLTGAFGWRGDILSNEEVEQNSYEHFKAWGDALSSVGQKDLINIELHTISPDTAADNIGKTLTVPYDLSHLFSDQFLLELPVYFDVLKEAGFHIDNNPVNHKYYPPNPRLTTVSVDYLTHNGIGAKASGVGGINLDPALGFIRIEQDDNGKVLPMAFQPVSWVEINGLQPILLKMVPVRGQKLFEE